MSPGFTIRLVPTTSYTQNISLGRIHFEVNYARRTCHRAARLEHPDCIIGTDPSQIVGYLSVKLAHRFRVPLILDVFDLWPELFILAFPRRLRILAPLVLAPLIGCARRNLRRADAVTALCNTYLNVACRQAPHLCPDRSFTAFNGIDVIGFRAQLPSAEERVTLARQAGKQSGEVWAIYAGTLGNNYDIPTLLEASRLLQERGSAVRIRIAGEGPLRPLVADFVRRQKPMNLDYLGNLSHQELIGLYGICDIGLCVYGPDSNVAMPDKSYDYMAAGLPIVNSLRGEFEMLVKEEDLGMQYSAGDAISLATALDRIATDEPTRHAMASRSYETGLRFDSGVQYARFADFIERTLLTQV